MAKKEIHRSALGRLTRLGTLAGRVGVSLASQRAGQILGRQNSAASSKDLDWKEAADRVAEVLGNLKGVPMKVGQMLSLHEDLLPPEVAATLASLQQDAPTVAFESMDQLLRDELAAKYPKIETIDPNAHAAASIGQVHRARLKDGREVVFKIQYPGIAEMVRADLKNLKGLMILLFSMLTRTEIEPIWQELSQRLAEELDYRTEAANMRRMDRLWKDIPEVIIPEVIHSFSTRRVLCMVYEKGISPFWACSPSYSANMRNRWGAQLLRLFLTGLFEHRFLHADPNLANFAFRKNGSIVVYDYGCMKQVPAKLAETYAHMTLAVLEDRFDEVPKMLQAFGVHGLDGAPVSDYLVAAHARLVREPFESDRYRFGEDHDIYKRLMQLGRENWEEARELTFPQDVMFINRSVFGHFGNLAKLGAENNWRELLLRFAVPIQK